MELCALYSFVPGFFHSTLFERVTHMLCRVAVHSHCCRVFPLVHITKCIYPFPSWWASGYDEWYYEHLSSWLLVNTCILLLGLYPCVGLLAYRVGICSALADITQLISKAVVPFDPTSNSLWMFGHPTSLPTYFPQDSYWQHTSRIEHGFEQKLTGI